MEMQTREEIERDYRRALWRINMKQKVMLLGVNGVFGLAIVLVYCGAWYLRIALAFWLFGKVGQ